MRGGEALLPRLIHDDEADRELDGMGANVIRGFGTTGPEPIPLNRAADPDEIAALVAWHASGESGYMTGSSVTIASGSMHRVFTAMSCVIGATRAGFLACRDERIRARRVAGSRGDGGAARTAVARRRPHGRRLDRSR